MQTVILSSDKGLACVPGMLYQWFKYNGFQTIQVAGFTPPPVLGIDIGETPFLSLGNFTDYPAWRWSNGLWTLLERLPANEDDLVIILMEDYWMTRDINVTAVSIAADYMRYHKDILRMDLTSDRLYGGNIIADLGSFGTVDFFESGASQYQISLQASIWRKSLLRQIIIADESPWGFELQGTERWMKDPFFKKGFRIVGTRQWPMRYQIVMDKGKLHRDGSWMKPERFITPEDWLELEEEGMMPNIPAWEEEKQTA